MSAINPLTAVAVVLATAATDAVYVMFTSAVVARKRVPAATWSSAWYPVSTRAGGDLEQRLVPALLLCGDQLHRQLGLCRLCRCWILDRRLCVHHLSAS